MKYSETEANNETKYKFKNLNATVMRKYQNTQLD